MLNLGFIIGIIGAALGILIGISVLNGTNSALVCPAPIFTNETVTITNPNYLKNTANGTQFETEENISFNPVTDKYYTSYISNGNSSPSGIVARDGVTNAIVGSNNIPSSGNANGFAFDSSNNIYVAFDGTYGFYNVTKLDKVDLHVINSIGIPSSNGSGGIPNSIVYDPNNNDIYVADQVASIFVYDTNLNLLSTISVPNTPSGMTYDSSNDKIYVSRYDNQSIVEIDPSTNTLTSNIIPTEINAVSMVFNSKDGYLYEVVQNQTANEGKIYVVNPVTKTIINTIDTNSQQGNGANQILSIDQQTGLVYYTDYIGAHPIFVLNSTGIITNIDVPSGNPLVLVANSNEKKLATIVVNGNFTFSVFDTSHTSIVSTITKNLIPNDSCTQARNTAWTVIGILPVGLFFGLFTLFGMVGSRQ